MSNARKIRVNVMGLDKKALGVGIERLNTMMNLKQAMANTVAGCALFDAIEGLKQTRLWRHGVKHDLKEAYSLYEKYESMHTSEFGDRYTAFLDYLDNIEAAIQPHVDILKMTAWQITTRLGMDLGEQRARLMTARILSGLAVRVFDTIMEQAHESLHCDLSAYYQAGRLTRMDHLVKRATDEVCMTKEKDIDMEFANDEQVVTAMRVILVKYRDVNFANDMMVKVVEQNPDVLKYCDKESRMFIKQRIKEMSKKKTNN